jgi:hypothetical protein
MVRRKGRTREGHAGEALVIKVRRAEIDGIERSIAHAVLTSTTMRDQSIKHPKIPPAVLTAAALLAIQSVTMALYGVNDVAVPSDVQHLNLQKDL